MPPFKEIHYFNELYVPDHIDWTRDHRRAHAGRLIIEQTREKSAGQLDFTQLQQFIDLAGDPPDDEWYGRIFSWAPADRLCGEITPDYCVLSDAGIAHLLRFNPRMKLILLLRDPIERTWSHIRMAQRHAGDQSVSAEEAWACWNLRDFSNYHDILSRWRRHCRPSDLCVSFLDHIASEPFTVLHKICDFLGVQFDKNFFPRACEAIHVGDSADLPASLYEIMRSFYRDVIRDLAAEFPDPCKKWQERHFK